MSGNARSTQSRASAKPKHAQSKSRALLTILLIAPLILAAASGANAQNIVGPTAPGSPITSTVNVTQPGLTVVGNTTIDVTSGNGISNFSGGALILDTTEGPISITAPGSGVFADGSPASITGSTAGSLLMVTGGANGVDAQNGSALNLPDGATVVSNAAGGAGVRIGGSDFAVGAIGNMTNVNITTTAASESGLAATRLGTDATMIGGSITLLGNGGQGLFVDTRGVANLTNVAITTDGSGTTGAFAESTLGGTAPTRQTFGSGTINITGGSIMTSGVNSTGAFADGVPSTITLNGTEVTINGDNSAAYNANAGTITATNTTTLTAGASSPAGVLSNGGRLTINGGHVTTKGAASFGFLVHPVSPVPALTPGGLGPALDPEGNPILTDLTPVTIPGTRGPTC